MLPATSAEVRSPVSGIGLHHLAVQHDFQMIDARQRAQPAGIFQRVAAGRQVDFVAGQLAVHGEADQRAVGGEAVAGLEAREPGLLTRQRARILLAFRQHIGARQARPGRAARRNWSSHRCPPAAGRRKPQFKSRYQTSPSGGDWRSRRPRCSRPCPAPRRSAARR